jgi:hypothetical protein
VATDYITAATLQIVAIAGATALIPKEVKAGNFLTKLKGPKWPEPPNRAARNLPEFSIQVAGSRVVNRSAAPTFSNSRGGRGDVVIWQEVQFAFVITWDTTDRNLPNKIFTVLEAALLLDPTLGLTSPAVKISGALTSKETEQNTGPAGGTKRLVQTIQFPLTFELHRADLVAAAALT